VDLSESSIARCILTDADMRNATLPRTVRFCRLQDNDLFGDKYTPCVLSRNRYIKMDVTHIAHAKRCVFNTEHSPLHRALHPDGRGHAQCHAPPHGPLPSEEGTPWRA